MAEPLTEELLDELLEAPSIDSYLDVHAPGTRSLSDYLNELLVAKRLKRSQVVRMANLNETFGYQIFTGARNPQPRQGAPDRLCHGAHPARDQPRARGCRRELALQ